MHSNQRLRYFSPLLAALLLTTPAASAAAPSLADVTANIKKTIETRFPGAHVLDVQPSAIPGLYELFMGDQIVYSDIAGDYLIVGSMVDTQTHDNLTEARLNDHGKIDFGTLPLGQGIKIRNGNRSLALAGFSD